MVVAGRACGGAVPYRLGYAQVGARGEQEFHNSLAAQSGAVDERVFDQMVRVQPGPARANALTAAGPVVAHPAAVPEVVSDPWHIAARGAEPEVVQPGAA